MTWCEQARRPATNTNLMTVGDAELAGIDIPIILVVAEWDYFYRMLSRGTLPLWLDQEYGLMADVPLLRAVSHSHSQDGELLDFTLQFTDGSATRFEALTSDFTAAMSIFVQCQISARKARGAQGKIDTDGAPPSDVVVIDPKRLGLIVGPERLPYLVVYRSNEPPLGIRLTVEDAQRLAGAFQRLLQKGRADA